VLYELLGEPVYVAVPRVKAQKKENVPNINHRTVILSQTQESFQPVPSIPQFLRRLQVLFDWDNDYERKNWDRYAYRDLAKQSFERIRGILTTEAAVD